MKIIDADKFLSYLIFSKHIDGLTCGEVKEAIELSKIDVLDKIRSEIFHLHDWAFDRDEVLKIIDKYRKESEKLYANCN